MKLSHINNQGNSQMVDVSDKRVTKRNAKAKATIKMQKETIQRIKDGGIKKGDVLSVSQIAGIMAAKNTSSLIPMCHPLPISKINITFEINEALNEIYIISDVSVTANTGVEMEALTAVSIAALTIYDMCKGIDKTMEITNTYLLEKTGGTSGEIRKL